MEIEYKWDMPNDETLARLFEYLSIVAKVEKPEEIHMHATYYDTSEQDVCHMHCGLRVRKENDASVCCLKISQTGPDGYRVRKEYEVAASDVFAGLAALPEVGAPEDVCADLAAKNLQPTCETDFERRESIVSAQDFSAALALDTGELRNHGNTAPISEIELEFKEGSQEAFHAFAKELQEKFDLVVQPLSKLARASAL